ncbi:MAG: translocation/assembly module TamB domain-containing protein [Succiniclasticum sp.]|jgi:translocation and assembly module TamB
MRNIKWILGVVAVLGAVCLAALHFVMPRILEQARPYAEQQAANYLNGSVRIGAIEWSGGFSLLVRDVSVRDRSGQAVAELPETTVSVNPFLALQNMDKAVSSISLRNPVLYVVQDSSQQWNFQNLLKPSQSSTTPFYGVLAVKEGTVRVSLPQGKWEFGVDGKVDGAHNPVFDMDFSVTNPAMDPVHVTGGVTTKGVGKIHFTTNRVDLAPFAALASYYGGVRDAGGSVTALSGWWHNDGTDTLLEGLLTLQDVHGVYPYGGKDWPFHVSGRITGTDYAVSTKDLTVVLDGQTIHLDGDLDYRDLNHLRGSVRADAPVLTYGGQTVRNVSVEGALVDQTVFLREAAAEYGGGTFHLDGEYHLQTGAVTAQAIVSHVQVPLPGDGNGEVGVNAELALAGSFDRKTGKLDVSVAARTADLAWREWKAHVLDFDTELTEQGAQIHAFSARVGEGAMTAAGSVGFDGTYALHGRLASLEVAPLSSFAGEPVSGSLSGQYEVQGHGSVFSAKTRTRIEGLRVRGTEVAEASGVILVDGRRLTLQDYVIQMPQGQHRINGTVDANREDPVLALTVTTDNVRLEPLLKLSGLDQKVQATGNLTNHMEIGGTVSHPRVSGAVHLSDGSAMGYLVAGVSGRYAYDDGAFTLTDGVVHSMSTTVTLSGSMDKNQNLDFAADAKDVDLSKLPVQDETAKLAGYVSLKGHLGGTLASPLFDGTVSSDSFSVNGVLIEELQGTLRSNGKDINELKASCRQTGSEGQPTEYSADLTLDIPHRDLRGRVGLASADVAKLLQMAQVDLPIQGTATGMIVLNGPEVPALLDGLVSDIYINQQHYDQMTLKADFLKGVLNIHTLKLQEDGMFPDDGILAAQGTIDFPHRTLQLEAGAVDANPAIITALMGQPVSFTGLMNVAVQLKGTFDNPSGNGSLEITDGTVAGANFDRATAMLTMDQGNIHLDQLLVERDIYKLTASGDMPLDLFRAKAERKDPNAQMNLTVDFNEASLSTLSAFAFVDWGTGDTKGTLNIRGTLDAPEMYGEVQVDNGSLKLRDLNNVIDNINLDVAFNGSIVNIRNLSARMGNGFVAASGTYDVQASADQSYHFQLALQNAQIDSAYVQARLNGNLLLEPERYFLRGRDTKGFPRRGYRPKVKLDLRLDDVLVSLPSIPALGDTPSNIGLDVTVTLGPKIHLYNKYLYDMWLAGQVDVQNSTLFPSVSGRIETTKGDITYLRTDFKIDEGRLTWLEPGTFLPNVTLNAHTSFGRYRVFCDISGPLSQDQLNFKLHSDPSLSQQTLMRMLMLQRFSVGGNSVTNEDMQNLLIAGLETTMLGDVEQMIKRTLHIDEFRIYLGRVENGVDFTTSNEKDLTTEEQKQYNWLVSKNVTERWNIGYTSSFNGDTDNVYTQYALTDRVTLTLSRDQDSNQRFSVQYHVGF